MYDAHHRWVIDAIDEEIATCEVDGIVLMRLPRWLLPEGARAGDALVVRHRRDRASSQLEIALALARPDGRTAELPRSGIGDIDLT